MITNTGKNLSVLIMTKPELNWQTFATWYSFKNNLPDVEIAVGCMKNKSAPFMFYQWCKRLKVRIFKFSPLTEYSEEINWLDSINKSRKWSDGRLLITGPYVMATDLIDEFSLSIFNKEEKWLEKEVWFLKNTNVEKEINDYFLENKMLETRDPIMCQEAKENHEPKWLVSCKKGCGKWINTSKGCPFSNAGGLVTADMTANEHRIINLWKKMVPLFTVVN